MRESIIQTAVNKFLTWLSKKSVTALYKQTHFWVFSWGLDEHTDLYLFSEESYHDRHRFGLHEETYDRKYEPTQNQHIQSVESVGEDRKTEPQTEKHKCRRCLYYDISSDYYPCSECVDYSNYSGEVEDEPQPEDKEVREVVRGFINIVNDMRNPTEEEKESVNKYIESISKPTGVNVFELMDEPQTDEPMKRGEPDEQMDR